MISSKSTAYLWNVNASGITPDVYLRIKIIRISYTERTAYGNTRKNTNILLSTYCRVANAHIVEKRMEKSNRIPSSFDDSLSVHLLFSLAFSPLCLLSPTIAEHSVYVWHVLVWRRAHRSLQCTLCVWDKICGRQYSRSFYLFSFDNSSRISVLFSICHLCVNGFDFRKIRRRICVSACGLCVDWWMFLLSVESNAESASKLNPFDDCFR